jgi:hypothetical protein
MWGKKRKKETNLEVSHVLLRGLFHVELLDGHCVASVTMDGFVHHTERSLSQHLHQDLKKGAEMSKQLTEPEAERLQRT